MANPCVLVEDSSTSDFEATDPELGCSEPEEEAGIDESNQSQGDIRKFWLLLVVLCTAVGVSSLLTVYVAIYLADQYLGSPNTFSTVRDLYYFPL